MIILSCFLYGVVMLCGIVVKGDALLLLLFVGLGGGVVGLVGEVWGLGDLLIIVWVLNGGL